ncbi:glucose-6-phosphate dehydrogenase, partial [Staphylococcus auricularis]
WQRLRQLTDQIDKEYNLSGNRLFYIAMNPHFFKKITKNIKKHGLADTSGFSRIIIEKPFGEDFNSAENLNNYIRQYFNEEDIFRIDHY